MSTLFVFVEGGILYTNEGIQTGCHGSDIEFIQAWTEMVPLSHTSTLSFYVIKVYGNGDLQCLQ